MLWSTNDIKQDSKAVLKKIHTAQQKLTNNYYTVYLIVSATPRNYTSTLNFQNIKKIVKHLNSKFNM